MDSLPFSVYLTPVLRVVVCNIDNGYGAAIAAFALPISSRLLRHTMAERILYIDPIGGLAGDMLCAALLDAGLNETMWREALNHSME